MAPLLRLIESVATQWPRRALTGLVIMTVALATAASNLEIEVDLTQLGSEDAEAAQAMNRVRDEFGDPAASIQVILDGGPGADVLTSDGMRAVEQAETMALDVLGDHVRVDGDGQPQILSPAAALTAMDSDGGDIGQDDAEIGMAVAAAIEANPQFAALVSDDLDVGDGVARAAVMAVLLDPALSQSERTAAGERLRDAFAADADQPLGDLHVTVFSDGLFVSGLLDAIRAEMPRMLGLAMLVVLLILAFLYRSVFDVLIGFVGLIVAVVWTMGFATLLGPAFLGWTGPMSQLIVPIPVLLIGLGVDFGVHLTGRYREQSAAGLSPPAAAAGAIRTVGAALVLAAIVTAVGFGSIATARLGMLADFGVFIAVGVLCAFVVMIVLVPVARVLRDRRRAGAERTVRELSLAWLTQWPARLATRAPLAGLGVATIVVVTCVVAATGLVTEFNRDDFIPRGSEVAGVLDHQAELFGGGVTETTYVVIDADMTDVVTANAAYEAQQRAAAIDGVRSVGGTPQVVSVLSLVEAVAESGATAGLAEDVPDGPGPLEAAWDGNGFVRHADVGAIYEMLRRAMGHARIDQLIAANAQSAVVQIGTTAGDTGADQMQQQLEAAFAPVEDAGGQVVVTSEPMIIAEMSEELAAFQIRSVGVTLAVVLVLLMGYYTVTGAAAGRAISRRPLLGVITMIPAVVGASAILGTMWVLGITFNVLTATLTALAVGIGVPYGIHVTNRFIEDLRTADAGEAMGRTLRTTGGALVGSALTTLGAFVVLSFSGLPPVQSLGLLGGAGIVFALLGALLVEPGALVWWARRRAASAPTHEESR